MPSHMPTEGVRECITISRYRVADKEKSRPENRGAYTGVKAYPSTDHGFVASLSRHTRRSGRVRTWAATHLCGRLSQYRLLRQLYRTHVVYIPDRFTVFRHNPSNASRDVVYAWSLGSNLCIRELKREGSTPTYSRSGFEKGGIMMTRYVELT